MKAIIKNATVYSAIIIAAFASCTKDLNRKPYVQTTSETVYNSPAKHKKRIGKSVWWFDTQRTRTNYIARY